MKVKTSKPCQGYREINLKNAKIIIDQTAYEGQNIQTLSGLQGNQFEKC